MIKQLLVLTEEEKMRLFAAKKENASSGVWVAIAKARDFEVTSLEETETKGHYLVSYNSKEVVQEEPKGTKDLEFIHEKGVDIAVQEVDSSLSPIKLKSLVSENFKKLNITIEAEGRGFMLRGDNAVGKSSVLDAIWTTLQGMKGNDTPEPIQQGKESAQNTVELIIQQELEINGDILKEGTIIKATRTFTQGGSTLNVKIDGKTAKSPATLLTWIIGESTITDPSDLWSMKNIDLKKYLTRLSGIEHKLDDVEGRKKVVYDKKFAVEQEILRFEKDLAEFSEIDAHMEPVDLTQIQKDIQHRMDLAEELRLKQEALSKVSINYAIKRQNIESTMEEIATAKRKLQSLEESLAGQQEAYNDKSAHEEALAAAEHSFKAYNECEDKEDQLKTLESDQKKYFQAQEKKKLIERVNVQKDIQSNVMLEVGAIERERKQLFASAKMPIEFLTITEDGVQYKGVPLAKDQISEAEGLELCMDILIAEKPNLRLISCKYGHALSTKTLERVLRKAKYQDYQIIIERVADNQTLEVEFLEK